MNTIIKPLYVLVPGRPCSTPCAYCQTRQYMVKSSSCLDENNPHYTLCRQDYYKRMAFARDEGYNAIFIIGDCKPQKNRSFLERITIINNMLIRPFKIIELVTSGRNLTRDYLYFLRAVIGVTTLDLKMAAFDDSLNQELAGMTLKDRVELLPLIQHIKELHFNLHLHLYLSRDFDKYQDEPAKLFSDCEEIYGAHHISLHDTPAPNAWLQAHKGSIDAQASIRRYVREKGTLITTTPHDVDIYTIGNLVVFLNNIDWTEPDNGFILQCDGRLYTQWDSKASLIF